MSPKDTTTVSQHVPVFKETPVVYATSESIPLVIDDKKNEKATVAIKKAAVPRAIASKTDTIPNPDLQAKMKRKRIFAVTGFSSSMLGLAALGLSFITLVSSVLITLLLLGGVILSALGVRSDRKVYKVLAKIGALAPIGMIALFFLAMIIIIIAEAVIPVE